MCRNMSFRRNELLGMAIDSSIKNNVAFQWELELVYQIIMTGVELVYDPFVKVNHYSATIETDGFLNVFRRRNIPVCDLLVSRKRRLCFSIFGLKESETSVESLRVRFVANS